MALVDEIQMEFLSETQREIAEIIGIDSYRELVAVFGGERINIPKVETIMKDRIPDVVRREYNGENHRELAHRLNLTVREVDRIIKSGGN